MDIASKRKSIRNTGSKGVCKENKRYGAVFTLVQMKMLSAAEEAVLAYERNSKEFDGKLDY